MPGDSDRFPRALYWAGRRCVELRHGLSPARSRRSHGRPDDGFLRETFTLPREAARSKAREFLSRFPKAAYMSGVENWRELPDGAIEFTMRRLPSAD